MNPPYRKFDNLQWYLDLTPEQAIYLDRIYKYLMDRERPAIANMTYGSWQMMVNRLREVLENGYYNEVHQTFLNESVKEIYLLMKKREKRKLSDDIITKEQLFSQAMLQQATDDMVYYKQKLHEAVGIPNTYTFVDHIGIIGT